MRLGDLVIHEGRTFIVRGIDPMGVRDRAVQLEDRETAELRVVRLAALAPVTRRHSE